MLNVDLHCHSNISDGLLNPSEVVTRAKFNGVDILALTDHDDISGVNTAKKIAIDLGLRYVTGVEISVTWAQQIVHIIGLKIDVTNIALIKGLATIRDVRKRRAYDIAKQLLGVGIPNALEGALKYVTNFNLISRVHFARYLVEIGQCINVQEVFRDYLSPGKPGGDIQCQWICLSDAINWIHGAGGIAILAHPGRYKYTQLEFDALFNEFKQYGGIGIEVITGSHTPAQYEEYARVAQYFGFLVSVGSDFHCPNESRIDLGKLPKLPISLKPVWYNWY